MAMPNPFQKLKHGVLLCKKNFNTFVETFNFLVDFSQNIKGDGDANGNGTIVFDRTVPDRPVIRSKINMDYPFGGGGDADVPWKFSLDSGWSNGRAQVGFDCGWGTPDLSPVGTISNTTATSDGYHYLSVTQSASSFYVSVEVSQSQLPQVDTSTGIMRSLLGIVTDGELTNAPHVNPVFYVYF